MQESIRKLSSASVRKSSWSVSPRAASACNHGRLLDKVRIDIDAEARPGRQLDHAILIAPQRRRIAVIRQIVIELLELVIRPRVRDRRDKMHHVPIPQAGRR